ncbi:prepilin-type cleavage/methylation domain-containing protein [Sulfurovum lithotrophicum]|nr:prepilin-type cleavage/methylation domain-containing protein [Sulfurovum lithotrophicum]
MYKNRKAFTMMELIFVIVIIGILSAIAIPKFAATRDDAVIAKTKATISSIRSAIASERQKRTLRGIFTPFVSLGGTAGTNQVLFDFFDNVVDGTGSRILEYGPRSCASPTSTGCWNKVNNTTYTYTMPASNNVITFTFDLRSRFDCDADANTRECQLLTE